MFDLDSPFPRAVSAFADYSFVLAGTIMIVVLQLFFLTDVIPSNALQPLFILLLLLSRLARFPQMPRLFSSLSRFFSFSRRDCMIAMPQIVERLAWSPIAAQQNFRRPAQSSIAAP
jgi:hypothetical protein